jgi:hypothetical protein
VSSKTIGRWERGEVQPRDKQWKPLAKALRVGVDDLRGAPPLMPEQQLRAQLDRIEANQEALAGAIDAISAQVEATSEQSATRHAELLRALDRRSPTFQVDNRARPRPSGPLSG